MDPENSNPKPQKRYSCLVAIAWFQGQLDLRRVTSDNPIQLNDIMQFLAETEGFSEDGDTIWMLDDDEITDLDLDSNPG